MGVPFAAVNRTRDDWTLEVVAVAGQSETWDPVSIRHCRLEISSITRLNVAGGG